MPPKEVSKVQSLQYVDLKEFLPDNVALHQRLESLGSAAFLATASQARPNLCEVPNLLSWVSCFATYTAVLTEVRPDLIKSRLAYLALIVAEARKHGGDGWRAYDSVFRQNVAHDPTADWFRLDASLHVFLAQRSDSGSFCQLCAATDHTHKDCAIRPFSASSTFFALQLPHQYQLGPLDLAQPSLAPQRISLYVSGGTRVIAHEQIVTVDTHAPHVLVHTEQ